MKNSPQQTAAHIRQQFMQLRQQLRLSFVAEYLLPFAALLIVLFSLSFAVDWLLDLSRGLRWGLLLTACAGCLIWLKRGLWRALATPLPDRELAITVERTQPGLGEAAMVVLELEAAKPTEARLLALAQRARQVEALTVTAIVDRQRARRRLGAVLLLAILPLLVLWLAPETGGIWLRRWLPPSDTPWPTRTSLYLPAARGGELFVPAGEQLVIEIALAPGYEAPETVAGSLVEDGHTLWQGLCDSNGDNRWFANVRAPATDATLRIEGGDCRLTVTVHPVARPRVRAISIVGQHPQYPAPRRFSDADSLADIAFLAESQVELALDFSVPVRDVQIVDAIDGPQPFVMDGDRRCVCRWQHSGPRNLTIRSREAVSGVDGIPTSLSVALQTDRVPDIQLAISTASRIVTTTGPQVGRRISPNAVLPVSVQMRDDFGLASASWELRIEMPDGKIEMLQLPLVDKFPADLRDFQRTTTIELETMQLPVDSRIQLVAMAEDRRYKEGAVGRSAPLTFQVVPPDSLYLELMRRMQGQRARLRQLLQQAENRRDELSREDAVVDTATASAWLRSHQQELHAVRVCREEVGRVVGEMFWNHLGSEDVQKLVRKTVLDAMDRLAGPLYLQQSDLLATLLDKPAGRADAAAGQEMIVIELQDLIAAMNQWESFADVVRQLDEIISIEKQVRKKAEQMQKSDTESLFDK